MLEQLDVGSSAEVLGVSGDDDPFDPRGVAGLYSGLPPWLLFSLPRAALRFSIYEEVLARHDASSARTGATQGGKAPAQAHAPQQQGFPMLPPPSGTPFNPATESGQQSLARNLLRAMISAAKVGSPRSG